MNECRSSCSKSVFGVCVKNMGSDSLTGYRKNKLHEVKNIWMARVTQAAFDISSYDIQETNQKQNKPACSPKDPYFVELKKCVLTMYVIS